MAKVKVVNNNLDQNINGNTFNNITSETVFSFGKFSVTSNFDDKKTIDHSTKLSSFSAPISLESLSLTNSQSSIKYDGDNTIKLNLDKSDINKYVRFGSAYEFFRFSVQNIIVNFPGSLFINSAKYAYDSTTYFDFVYDSIEDTSTFGVPVYNIDNKFNLIYNADYSSVTTTNTNANLNTAYGNYIIWSTYDTGTTYTVLSFTGSTKINDFIRLKVQGNPFPFANNTPVGRFNFHIKPNGTVFEEYREGLKDYESYIISERTTDYKGFKFMIKSPSLLDDGSLRYNDTTIIWPTTDGYNIDIDTTKYSQFLEILFNIGNKFDLIKTDIIARMLSTSSIKAYDLTDEGKITKLLRLYGQEFDQLRVFIDSIQYINKVTYDKKDNVPDTLVSNLAYTLGWDYFSFANDVELVESFFTIDGSERNLNEDFLPAEIDLELWRRIIINTNHYWKSMGTREAMKSMLLLIGIPEPFIDISEYIYTVDGKINPSVDPLTINDYPTSSFPYDADGYPKAPAETNFFYFQISGNTDSGQHYLDVFRRAGFDLTITRDNKKSWVQSGSTLRSDAYTSTEYYQDDSKLVINTKEVDLGVDPSRAIEYDVYTYLKESGNTIYSGTTMTFLQFVDDIQRNLINAKNRKTITDGRGGWYPTLLKVYLDYLSNPLTNQYTFADLYHFLSKYNSIFNKFVQKLLSPTIIIRRGGEIIRNTIFTKQKFMYRRGDYMGIISNYGGSTGRTDFTYDSDLMFLGDDGATYLKFMTLGCGNWTSDVVYPTTTTTTAPITTTTTGPTTTTTTGPITTTTTSVPIAPTTTTTTAPPTYRIYTKLYWLGIVDSGSNGLTGTYTVDGTLQILGEAYRLISPLDPSPGDVTTVLAGTRTIDTTGVFWWYHDAFATPIYTRIKTSTTPFPPAGGTYQYPVTPNQFDITVNNGTTDLSHNIYVRIEISDIYLGL